MLIKYYKPIKNQIQVFEYRKKTGKNEVFRDVPKNVILLNFCIIFITL